MGTYSAGAYGVGAYSVGVYSGQATDFQICLTGYLLKAATAWGAETWGHTPSRPTVGEPLTLDLGDRILGKNNKVSRKCVYIYCM